MGMRNQISLAVIPTEQSRWDSLWLSLGSFMLLVYTFILYSIAKLATGKLSFTG